jgi:hypothetical protein
MSLRNTYRKHYLSILGPCLVSILTDARPQSAALSTILILLVFYDFGFLVQTYAEQRIGVEESDAFGVIFFFLRFSNETPIIIETKQGLGVLQG